MTSFFDTSAIIVLTKPNEPAHSWILNEFTIRQAAGPIVINDVVYAEVSAGMSSRTDVDQIISRFGLERTLRDDAALFEAGQRFKRYRLNQGPRTNLLSDFFIGASAWSLGVPLVTTNPKDFRGFFSGLTIVHPGGQEVVP